MGQVMPEITVSDGLYRQLEVAAGGKTSEAALWKMLYQFSRSNDPTE